MNLEYHIGIKALKAAPMNKRDYCAYRGWDLPEHEDPDELGFLVEYGDGPANHEKHDGYISWSPAKQFLRAYRKPGDLMNFSLALEYMRQGRSIARTGWNGKGMFVYYVPEGRYVPTTVVGGRIANANDDGLVPYRAYVAMKTVDNDVVPWIASQSDLLADDWVVVD